MSINRDEFLKTVKNSFSAYYDVREPDEGQSLPQAFRADYFSRAEKYWLSKNITVWANETNEFAYVFSAPGFDEALAAKCIDFALSEGLPMVKPHKEHQYTNIKVILLADSVDKKVAKYVKNRKFSKSYKFSLHGFSTLKAAIVDLSEKKTYTNSAGYELVSYFSKLFAAEEKGNEAANSNKTQFFKE